MALYRRILLAVDLSEDSLAVGRTRAGARQALGAEVELLHVVEFVPVEPMGETLMPAVQIEDELLERARAAPRGARRRTRPAPGRLPGREPATSRARSCASRASAQSDLIVLGSRERHGLSILVNLTEDTVLHAAPCDVLAVRVARAQARR